MSSDTARAFKGKMCRIDCRNGAYYGRITGVTPYHIVAVDKFGHGLVALVRVERITAMSNQDRVMLLDYAERTT
jgi:hypothetical protein